MERRRYKRIPVYLKATIVLDGKTYRGIIDNVSIEGVKYLITYFFQITKDFTPKEIIELNFQIPSDETLTLNSELIWFSRTSPNDNTLTLGLRIIDPTPKYKEFIKSLDTG